MNFKNAYVITSVAGGGKSTFLNIAKRDFATISADEISHKFLKKNAQKLASLIDKKILKNGEIDRKILGDIVFKNPQKLKLLENFLHPRIKRFIFLFCFWQEKFKNPYFIEIPLYFESKNYNDLKNVILIYADKKICLKRLKNRSKYSNSKALKILNSQIPINEKLKKATIIIKNTKSKKDFEKKCINILKNLKKEGNEVS